MTEAEEIAALKNSFNALAKVVNEQAQSIEKLARIQGLEYSQDLKDWVSKSKMDDLRRKPREIISTT